MVNNAIFDSDASEIVMVKDIELYSMCEHHLLPFIGRAHVAYIPNGKVIGLSKVARIVDVFARRLQIQEQLTTQMADALMGASSFRRGGGDRGEASLHDDARSGETKLRHEDLLSPRRFQRGCAHPERVPRAPRTVTVPMLLTVSKRLEFSASRRLFFHLRSASGEPRCLRNGDGCRYGTGRNYVAYFVFTGEVNRGQRHAGQHQRDQGAGGGSLARALRS